jgi:predicted ABC-type ATPase
MFYWRGHQRADAELHDPILEDGDHAKAEAVSRKVAKRLGLTDEEIDKLTGQTDRVKRRVEFIKAKTQSAVLLNRKRDWDESEHPRDEHGRWTESGGSEGGDTSASSLLKPEHVTVDQLLDRVPGAREKVAKANARLEKLVPTDAPVEQGGFKKPDGRYTADRIGTQQFIISRDVFTPEQIAAATPKPGEQPTLHLLGGRGGSGKSWFTGKNGTIEKGPLYLNSDDFKKALPEYQGWNSPLLHEESSDMLAHAEQAAREHRLNVIVDGTMRSTASLNARVDAFKKAGYRIVGHYMYTSPANAAQRALERFVRGGETGRYVMPEYSLSSTTNEASFDGIKDRIDAFEIYDNNGKAPKFYARGERVKDYKPGAKTPPGGDMKQTKEARAEWANTSPLKTMDDAKRMALAGQQVLNAAAKKLEGPGVEIGYGEDKFTAGLKGYGGGEARVAEKAETKYGGNIAAVSDLARVSFVVDHPDKANQIFDGLSQQFELASEPWRITHEEYADRSANVRLPNGLIAEVQVMDKTMQDAKKTVHNDYKITRAKDVDKTSKRYKDALARQVAAYTAVQNGYTGAWKEAMKNAVRLKAWIGTLLRGAAAGLARTPRTLPS